MKSSFLQLWLLASLVYDSAFAQVPLKPPTASTPPFVSGNATWFTGLGGPYGGCGVPQKNIDSQDFIALNVFNTFRKYEDHKRPLPPDQIGITGMYNNGHNCGRWVRVKIGDMCVGGFNDGDQNKDFCRGGAWKTDNYTGSMLDMVVADSCGDPNAWCRDDPFHIDLAQPAINRFVKEGQQVGTLLDHWNNRQVFWEFITHPSYKEDDDIRIGFMRGAMNYWAAIALTNLYNGLHGVEFQQDGKWMDAKMNSDMGQSYIIEGLKKGGTDFAIRVRDVDEKYVKNGRIYKFSLLEKCQGGGGCVDDYLEVKYTIEDSGSGAGGTGTANTTVTQPTLPKDAGSGGNSSTTTEATTTPSSSEASAPTPSSDQNATTSSNTTTSAAAPPVNSPADTQPASTVPSTNTTSDQGTPAGANTTSSTPETTKADSATTSAAAPPQNSPTDTQPASTVPSTNTTSDQVTPAGTNKTSSAPESTKPDSAPSKDTSPPPTTVSKPPPTTKSARKCRK